MLVAVQPVLYRRPSASAGLRTARRPPDLPGNVSRTVSLHGWARTGGGFWRTYVIHAGVDRHDLVVDLLHDLGIIETPREDSATWERAPCRMTAMTSFIAHTTVDCRNAYELSEWWKQVLGYVHLEGDPKEPGDEECLIVSPGSGHRLLFIEVPDEKRGKNRIHFDIQPYTGTRDEEVRRVVALGAEEVGDQRDHYRTDRVGRAPGSGGQRVLHPSQQGGAGGGPDAAAPVSGGGQPTTARSRPLQASVGPPMRRRDPAAQVSWTSRGVGAVRQALLAAAGGHAFLGAAGTVARFPRAPR